MIDINKFVYVLMMLIMVGAVISYAVLFARINSRDTQITVLEARLTECGEKVRSADKAVERQNAAIEAVRVDTVFVEKRVKEIVKKYDVKREIVAERIAKDSSCENEISVIDELLRGFSLVGLRAKDGDKN